MVICAYCRIVNDQSGKFCRKCGKKFDNPVEKVRPSRSFAQFETPLILAALGENKTFEKRITGEKAVLRCGFCGGKEFVKDSKIVAPMQDQLPSNVVFLTCETCGDLELFNKGISAFDFD